MFSALCKLAIVSPEVKEEVLEIATGLKRNVDSDLQQRAVEFCVLAEDMPEMLRDVFEALPHYPDIDPEASPTGEETPTMGMMAGDDDGEY